VLGKDGCHRENPDIPNRQIDQWFKVLFKSIVRSRIKELLRRIKMDIERKIYEIWNGRADDNQKASASRRCSTKKQLCFWKDA